MSDSDDPLAALLTDDSAAIDRARLANFLQPYIRFDKKSHELNFLPEFDSISSNDAKIEVILVASKARSLLFEESEGLTPSQLIKLEVMPEGSVKSSLKKLYDSRKVKKDTDGKYLMPPYRVSEVLSKNQKD